MGLGALGFVLGVRVLLSAALGFKAIGLLLRKNAGPLALHRDHRICSIGAKIAEVGVSLGFMLKPWNHWFNPTFFRIFLTSWGLQAAMAAGAILQELSTDEVR